MAGARETVFQFPCKLGVLEKKNPLVLNYGGVGVVFGTVGDGHQTSLAAIQFKINQRDQSIIPEQELDRSSFYRLFSNAEQEACALNSGSIGVIKNPDGAGHLFMEMELIKLLFEKEPVLAEISRRFPNKSIASLHDAVEIVLANLPKGICISDNVLFRLHKDNSVISYEFLTGEGRNIVPLLAVTTRSQDANVTGEGQQQNGPPNNNNNQQNNNGQHKPAEKKKDKIFVFVNDGGKAKMVEVKTGISDYDNIEILSGLSDSSQVVTGPFLVVSKRLKDGERIRPPQKVKKKEDKPAAKDEKAEEKKK